MSARARRSLRLLSVAFGAGALLLVLQTLVFQLLPYDSSATGRVAIALRVAFWLADVTMLVAFVALVREGFSLWGLAVPSAISAAFVVLSGALGLGAHALGLDGSVLRWVAQASSGAEPVVSLGAIVLATLVIGALESRAHVPRRGVGVVTTIVAVSAVVSVAFRIARVVDSGPRSVGLAWVSWGIEVARPALVGVFALSHARAVSSARGDAAHPEGPYRAPGVGAPRGKLALDRATAASLAAAGRALAFYRGAYLGRVAASVGGMLLLGVVLAASTSVDGLAVLAVVPLAGVSTGVLVVVALFKLLALPRATRAVTIGAIVTMGFAVLLDGAFLALIADAFLSNHRYGSRRHLQDAFVAYPLAAFVSGVSLVLVASALGRVGAELEDDLVVARARWIQALSITSALAPIGAVLAGLAISGEGAPGIPVVLGLALAGIGSAIAVLVLHALLVRDVREAVAGLVADVRPG